MQVEWIFGLIGGLMIGSAAAMFLLVNGRIMGASITLGRTGGRTGTAVLLAAMPAGMYAQPWLRIRLDRAVAAVS